jgi:hypothetical protein
MKMKLSCKISKLIQIEHELEKVYFDEMKMNFKISKWLKLQTRAAHSLTEHGLKFFDSVVAHRLETEK